MKIAFCTFVSLSCYGGTEVWIAHMARLLKERGHDVRVYATPYSYGGRKIDPELLIPGMAYRESWHNEVNADVAYVYYYSPLVWRVLFSLDCPKIAGMHPPGIFYKRSPRAWLFRLFGNRDLRSFSAIRIMSRLCEFKHKRVFQIPEWVDTAAFTYRKQYLGKFTLLYVGRRHKDRRWDVFLKLAFACKTDEYDFDFVATGESEGPVRGLGVVNHEDMPEVYSQAHVLVHPTLVDMFSLTILEALSCGLPVITTPIKSHTAMELPLLYAQTVDEFKGQVLKIYEQWLNNVDDYQQYQRALRQSVLKYDINNVFPKLERMFVSLAKTDEGLP